MRIPLAVLAVVVLLLGGALVGVAALRPAESRTELAPITVQVPRIPTTTAPPTVPGLVAPPPPLDDDSDDDDGDDDGPDDD